jgi:hypothetical protein
VERLNFGKLLNFFLLVLADLHITEKYLMFGVNLPMYAEGIPDNTAFHINITRECNITPIAPAVIRLTFTVLQPHHHSR